jgi:hypothetical protein
LKKSFILLIILILPTTLFAEITIPTIPTAIVTKLKGTVLFEGAALHEGELIEKIGKLETKDQSYIQLKIGKWKNNISIGPNSIMETNFSDEKKYTLDSGTCRWKSFGKSESHGKIFTKKAALGVRGTDFYLKYTPILNETELVIFDGEVMLENLNDKANSALVKKGQWGGIGGRFGEKISPILDLPATFLKTIENSLE